MIPPLSFEEGDVRQWKAMVVFVFFFSMRSKFYGTSLNATQLCLGKTAAGISVKSVVEEFEESRLYHS